MKDRSLLNQAHSSRRARRCKRAPSAPLRTARPRARPFLGITAALVLLGASLGGWRWRQRVLYPPPRTATNLSPTEARLLAAAAHDPANPRPYLQLAEEYAGSERPASALWAYAEAAARSPGDEMIRLKLAALIAQMGHIQAAEGALQSVAAGKTPAAAQARQDLAGLQLSTGRPAAALEALRTVGTEAASLRGRTQEAAGDDAAAAAEYRRAGAAGDPEGYERLARLELARGRLAAAREAVRALGGLPDARPAVLLLIAAIHAAAGTPRELDTALDRVRRCLELQPGSAEAHYQAGLLLERRGDRAAALDQLEQAVRLDPHHAGARGRLADLLQATGQTARAHRERAVWNELRDQPDRALAELRRATAADPDSTLPGPGADEPIHLLVNAATEIGEQATAIREAQEALKRHPGNLGLMLQLGLLYRQGGSRAALEPLCRDWMARQPGSGMPYWLLGDQALRQTRVADAIHSFQTACAREPGRADFCMALALAYIAAGGPDNLTRARPWLEKAIERDPRASGPYRQLGWILERAGDLEGARRCYLRSLDLQPDQPGVLSSLVRISARFERLEVTRLFVELSGSAEARAREREPLAHRVRTHPTEPAPRVELARFLIRQGQLAAARNQLERAAEVGPAGATARQALAMVERLLRVQSPGGAG